MIRTSLILCCVGSFIIGVVLIFVWTDPGNGIDSGNMTLGTDGDSDMLILTPNSPEIIDPSVDPSENGTTDLTDLSKIKPLDFLSALKAARLSTPEVLIQGKIKNWITKNDLPALLALTDSTEPCASVALISSSVYNGEGSTVGQEALYMIEGCRAGAYPPALNSGGFTGESKKELVEWCRSQIAAAQ